MRNVIKSDKLLTLCDVEYPVTFHIIKSGHIDCYLVIDEDPFDHSLNLKNTKEVLELCHTFDTTIVESDLPKLNDITKENQTKENTTKESTI